MFGCILKIILENNFQCSVTFCKCYFPTNFSHFLSHFPNFQTNFISQNPPSPTENPPLSTQNLPPHNKKTTKTPPPKKKKLRSKRERLRDWGKDCGWIGFWRGWVGGVWIGFCRGWVRGVWIGGEVTRSDWVEGGSEVRWGCRSEIEGGSANCGSAEEHGLEEEHKLGCRTVTYVGVSCSVKLGLHWAWSVLVRSLRECVRGVNDFQVK